jgi:hypothetical protein
MTAAANGGPGSPGLLAHHLELLARSAISDEVAAARGYFTATKRTELEDLGFERFQRRVPALVLPVWGVDGERCNYQARPDRPRIDRERGREVKYETVAGSTVRPDVPPACRQHLGSVRRPLWITEGIRKGDALASVGLCAVALLGVDCFRCDDWERIALDERHVYVVFDNDVMRNPNVHGALERITKYLAAKGAALHYVYLPESEGKVGVDDYLAASHSVDELYALAEDELRAPPPTPKPERPPAWPTAWLLDSVERLLRRYVVFPSEHEVVALAAFTLHTWALDAAMATPYVLIVSPEKRSGKTRLLEALELVAREPLRTSSISEAGLFQAVEKWRPTLLVDEVDRLFGSRSERSEAVSGVINAGNRRGAYVIRGSQDGEPVKFGTFSAKVLSGINNGKVPDTVTDRAIVVAMRRRGGDDAPVEDLFPGEMAETLEELRGRLDDWAAENMEALTAWRRKARISALDDRQQEAWDPLLAIADLAEAGWPERARAAAEHLAGAAVDAGEEAHGHALLVALRGVFEREGSPLASKAICVALNDDETLPFASYSHGSGISARALAKLLRPYGIKPRSVREAGKADTAKGYHAEQFADVWPRYVDTEHTRATEPVPEPAQAAQAAHPSPDGNLDVPDVPDVPDERQAPRGVRAPSNGDVPIERREPTCQHPAHRASDWALPAGEMWVCGVCHPPPASLNGGVVRRAS